MRKLILTVVSGLVIFSNTYGEIKVKEDMQLVKKEGEKEVSVKEVSAKESIAWADSTVSLNRPPVVVLKGHPRIWITPERLKRIKKLAAAKDPVWQEFEATCQKGNVMELGLAWQVTGNQEYALRGIEKLREVTKRIVEIYQPLLGQSQGKSGDHETPNNEPKGLSWPFAMGYDWLYDAMTAAERKECAEAFEHYWHWLSVAGFGSPGWRSSSVANIMAGLGGGGAAFNGFAVYTAAMGLCGIAFHGDTPLAEKALTEGLERFERGIVPWLSKMRGVGWPFGNNNYTGCFHHLAYFLEGARTGAGVDLWGQIPSWREDALYYFIYCRPCLGATGADVFLWGYGELRQYWMGDMECLLASASSEAAAGIAKNCYTASKLNASAFTRLIFEDKEVKARPLGELPRTYLSEYLEHVYSRGSWGEDTTYVTFCAGRLIKHHGTYPFAGDFNIFKHDWLAGRTSASGSKSTDVHNCVTVGGRNQTAGILGWRGFIGSGATRSASAPKEYREFAESFSRLVELEDRGEYAYARLVALEDRGDYVYAAGDLANAYNQPQSKVVEEYYRQLLFIRPDYVVVFDRIRTVNPEVCTWHLHSWVQPATSGDLATIERGEGRLFSRTLLPAQLKRGEVNKEKLYHPYFDAPVSAAEPGKETFFLHLLQTADKGSGAPVAAERLEAGEKAGLKFSAAGKQYEVRFSKAGKPGGSIRIDGGESPFADRIVPDGIAVNRPQQQGAVKP